MAWVEVVTQIFNLPFRRFLTGGVHAPGRVVAVLRLRGPPITNRRYGRLQTCATDVWWSKAQRRFLIAVFR